jgi:hypothetical protein
MAWIRIRTEKQRKRIDNIQFWKLPFTTCAGVFCVFELYRAFSMGELLVVGKTGIGSDAPFATQPLTFLGMAAIYGIAAFACAYWLFVGIAKAFGKIEYPENPRAIPPQD